MKTKFPEKWFRSLNGDADYYRYNIDSKLYNLYTDGITNQSEFFDILINLKVTLDSVYLMKYRYISMRYSLDESRYFAKIESNNIDYDESLSLFFKFIDINGNILYITTGYINKFGFKFDYELFCKQFSSDVSIIKVNETTFKNTMALNNIIDECKSIVDERKQEEIKQYRIDNNLCPKCGSEFDLIGSAYITETFGNFNYYRCKNDNCKHEFKRKTR